MKRGKKPSAIIKFLKKIGCVPRKPSGGTTTGRSDQSNTARGNSHASQQKSQYSIGGEQDIEADLQKKKSKTAEKAAAKDKEKITQQKSKAIHTLEALNEGEDEPQFEITGDTRSTKQQEDPDAGVVVPFLAIEEVMSEADQEHATLKNVVELLARVSSKGASGRYDAPMNTELWTPRDGGIPEQESIEFNEVNAKVKEANFCSATATVFTKGDTELGATDSAVEEIA